MLISPVDTINEIFKQAKLLGFYNVQIGNLLELYSKEKTMEISVQDLFCMNKERVFVLAVRYLAIEAYYKKQDYGFSLYKKMQLIRCNKPFAETQFRDLIDSFEKNGYDNKSFVTVLDNLSYSSRQPTIYTISYRTKD